MSRTLSQGWYKPVTKLIFENQTLYHTIFYHYVSYKLCIAVSVFIGDYSAVILHKVNQQFYFLSWLKNDFRSILIWFSNSLEKLFKKVCTIVTFRYANGTKLIFHFKLCTALVPPLVTHKPFIYNILYTHGTKSRVI